MAKKFNFSQQHLKFDEIVFYYNSNKKAIVNYYSNKNPFYERDFFSKTTEEINIMKVATLEELEHDYSLKMLAAIEAHLRIDFILRCLQRDKNPVSRAFRDLQKDYGYSVELDDVILETWKKSDPSTKRIIGELKGCMKYRHWLAHGRYWMGSFSRKRYTVDYLFYLARLIQINLNLMQLKS